MTNWTLVLALFVFEIGAIRFALWWTTIMSPAKLGPFFVATAIIGLSVATVMPLLFIVSLIILPHLEKVG